jgi:hypothetical protein
VDRLESAATHACEKHQDAGIINSMNSTQLQGGRQDKKEPA